MLVVRESGSALSFRCELRGDAVNRRDLIRNLAVAALVLGSGYLLFSRTLGRKDPGELGFFYDVSAKRIFTAPRDTPPPVRGVDGPEEDGFRAVVISSTGRPADRKTWKVAYLEKFSPELRQRMQTAQRTQGTLEMGRLESQTHRFVRLLEGSEWHALNTPEAETILNSWAQPGPDGVTPALCSP